MIGGGTGAISYAVKTDVDSVGATVDNAGLVSGATKAGSVVITVSRAADANYEASSVDVIVAFDKSDADVTVATPTAVSWGNNVQISGVIGGGTGAITYVVKDDSDSIGATVDGSTGLVSGATKAGSVVITVSRAADANYNASSADVIVTFDKSDADVTVATPAAVIWGTDIQIPAAIGGGTGAITYIVKTDVDSVGATVDNAGLVSGATKAGSVVITVSRAADANYEASSVDVTVAFDKSDIGFIVAQPGSVSWGTDVQISGVIGGGTGAITYVVKTDSDSIGATVDVSTGLVSGATKAGAIVVTVSRAADANYNAFSADVIVTFDKSDAAVTVATPTSVMWGTDIQIPTAIGGGTGAITYTVTDSDLTGATVDNAGLVSGATKAGSVVITVSRAADANYEASSADVIVTFSKSDSDVTVATPTSVMWGTDIQIPAAIGGGTGAITYVVKDDVDSIGATVDVSTGLVSGATKAGSVVITLSRAADANYEASSADVIVTFSKSDSDVTVATPTSVMWGTDIQIPAAIGGGTGAITYVVKDDADSIGATVDGSGLVSGATKAGSVVITISRAADANYEASSIDLTVTFDKVDAAVTVATPATVTWGTDIQIPAAIGGGTGAITYTVKTDADSIGATVDGSGLVSEAAKAGSVVITVSRAADDNYEASSVDVIVTFDKSDAAVTVATPTSVMWGTDIQIPTAIGGGTGAITYTVTDSDLTGATVDNAGLVSGATKVGSVTITVNRAADANYNASSVDVIVSFDKSDADITVVTPASVAWDTNAQIAGVSGGGTGAITYVVKTDADSIGATVDGSGLVSGATKAGSVVITISRAGDDNYEASSVDVTVVFDKSDADVTVATPTAVSWGNNVQIPTAIGGGTGAISYTVKTDADSIGATVDVSTGLVSGATEAGSVVITVSRAGDDNYEASSVDVIVTFNKSDSDVTVTTPGSVSWGTDVQISDVIGGGTGAITYAVKDDSDSIGATVDGSGLVSGATKAGAIIVTVSRAGDDNYEASSVDVIVAFNKSDAAVTVVTPGSVVWGTDVQISEVIGGGTGAISYAVKTDVDSVGATVDNAGLVSGATKAGSVVITVSRAADANYEASSVDVIVAFDKSDVGFIVAQPGSVSWGTDVQISGVIGGGTGAITYVVKTDADSIGATVDVSTGLVSGATKVGSVVITVSRAADANYNAFSADVIVTFDKSDADVTVATPAAVIWGNDIQIPAAIGGGTGAITYTLKTDADSVGATVDNAGLVSGATKAGSVVITVSRAADANYEASSVDVIVAFDKSDIGFIVAQPGSVSWGTDVQISGVIGGGTGAISYAVKTDSDSIGATVDGSTGLVSGATKVGSVVITVSRAADANYNAFSADVIVTFDKSDADVTVATPAAVIWGNDIQIPAAIGGGTGAITYTLKTDADSVGATVDNAGLVSGATKAGSVVITVSRAADANYEASSVDVIVAFDKSDIGFIVAQPGSVSWGTDVQISGVIGGGTGAISYAVKTDSDSIGATVDGSGLVSGAIKSGSVTVTVNRATDANYEASSVDVTVVFDRKVGTLAVATPAIDNWSTPSNKTEISNAIALSGNLSGLGNGTVTYAVDPTGTTAINGRVGLNDGIVSADSSGDVVVTVTRAADDYYTEADASVTISLTKAILSQMTWSIEYDINSGVYYENGETGETYIKGTARDGTYAEFNLDTVKTTATGNIVVDLRTGVISGVTGPGDVYMNVTAEENPFYELNPSTIEVKRIFNASTPAVTASTPASVPWGTNVQISGVTGGGTGAITYATKDDTGSTGASVDVSTGLVSGATSPGSLTITVSRAGDDNYEASSADVIVTFDYSDDAVRMIGTRTPAVSWGTDTQISGVTGGGTGAISYAVTEDADFIGATVDGSGVVSGATKVGSVTITVSRAADANYNASSVDIIVDFDKSDADVTVATPTAVEWGNNVQIPTAIGGGTGAITYAVKTDADSIGATVDGSGVVSGATEAGSVVITISRAGDANYNASSVDVIVTFNKSDSDVTVATPGSVSWGNNVQLSDVIGGGTGAITYAVKDDSDSIGATIDNAGLVSGATKAGAIIVTVSRAGDANYEASSVDVIVAFDKSDIGFIVAIPGTVSWGTDVQIPPVTGGGTGAVTYAVKTDADSIGATVDGSTGLVSGATKVGSVTITVSRAADANYNASSLDVDIIFAKTNASIALQTPAPAAWDTNVQIVETLGGALTYTITDPDSTGATVDNAGLVSGATKPGSVTITVNRAGDVNYEASSLDVIVTFDKSDIGFIVAQPGSVSWGTDVQISGVIGGGTGAITYVVKTDSDSIGATVDGSTGLVSGATKAGSVVITVSRAADTNYNASSADVIVTFDKSDIGFIVAQPGSVSWGTDVQISGVIGGGTGAITYVVKTDSDSIGATVDVSTGLVSGATKAGSVVITVSRAADANYNASSADVIVTFDKSDIGFIVAQPGSVSWGTDVQISGVIGGGTGAITYVVKTDSDSIGATVDGSTGLVSGATKAGAIVVTVSRAADANYNASSADVIVTFDKSDADVTVATPTSVVWGTDVQISGVTGGGTGAISYAITTDADSIGATVDGSTGLVSDVIKGGAVVVTVSRAGDDNFEASSVDVVVTFDKKASIGTLGADSMSIFSSSSFTLYKYGKISRNVGYNENGQTVTYSGPGITANADGTVMSQSDGLVEVRAGKNCVIRFISGFPHVYVLKDTVCNAQVTFEENDFYTEKVEFIEFIAAPDS